MVLYFLGDAGAEFVVWTWDFIGIGMSMGLGSYRTA